MPPLSRFKRFNVGPVIDRGEDPRPAIMERIQNLAFDEGLLINAPFLPSPLIEMLGAIGFAAKVEPGNDGAWLVYFWKADCQ
jgi:hypothetical protein